MIRVGDKVKLRNSINLFAKSEGVVLDVDENHIVWWKDSNGTIMSDNDEDLERID